MKFLTFIDLKNNTPKKHRLGIISQGQILDVTQAAKELKDSLNPTPAPSGILDVIENQERILPLLKQILNAHTEGRLSPSSVVTEESIQILAPIPRPLSMRDGYAFRQHVEAARRNRGVPMIPEFDQFPVFYFTNHLAVTGPGDINVQKLAQNQLDYELEVAVVIGKECRNVPAHQADDCIFGFMIMNDWSARHLQMEEMKLNLGPAKGKDFATSLGPILVTRDELKAFAQSSPAGERHSLKMKAFVNGKQLSEGNLKDMSWTFAQIIERASYGVTLYPGEVIGSGTVGTGCLLELNGSKITDHLWLKPGDEVILEVDQLGQLKNRICGEPPESN
jgi:fumarylacetoacetate (FAA) hydrolase